MTSTAADIRRVTDLRCIRKKSAMPGGAFFALHFDRTADIPEDIWQYFAKDSNAFLQLEYLQALEEAHDEGLELRFVMFRNEHEEFVGIAAFQITHFQTSEDAYSSRILKWINKVGKYLRRGHIHNILISGNAIATGEHGFIFNPDLNASSQAHLILDAMKYISKVEGKKGRSICAMVAKDFYPNHHGFTDALSQWKFSPFQVDHNMVMPLLPEWNTFEAYLADLNTKCRTKAKSAYKKSEKIRIVSFEPEDIRIHAHRMQELYNAVYSKADFRLGKMNISGLEGILDKMNGSFFVHGFFLEDKLVGFATAMNNVNSLEAHVIGIDYEFNREHAVYQRMLYHYVELAIQLKSHRIIFGRTAAEIKSTIGADPVDLTIAIYHPQRISNALLNLILSYVKPSAYEHRNPWKAETSERLKRISLTPTPHEKGIYQR